MGLPPYLVLLRVGFTESRCHHRDWCALTAPFHPYQARYTAVSPVPCMNLAVCFLWHFPWGHPHWTLSSTLLCGARTFLPPPGSGERSSGLLRPERIGVAHSACIRVSLLETVGLKYRVVLLPWVALALRGGTTSMKLNNTARWRVSLPSVSAVPNPGQVVGLRKQAGLRQPVLSW